MNIIFSNNSNNNADGCLKLHKYTEVKLFFFKLHDYGQLPLDHWYCNSRFQFRCSNFAWVLILSLRSFLEDFVFSTTDLTDVPQYVTCMWNDQTPHNDRFCPVCNSGMIEDEFHFLLHCPKYSIPREKVYNQIQHNFVDFNQLSSTELLIKLMNSQNFSLFHIC